MKKRDSQMKYVRCQRTGGRTTIILSPTWQHTTWPGQQMTTCSCASTATKKSRLFNSVANLNLQNSGDLIPLHEFWFESGDRGQMASKFLCYVQFNRRATCRLAQLVQVTPEILASHYIKLHSHFIPDFDQQKINR